MRWQPSNRPLPLTEKICASYVRPATALKVTRSQFVSVVSFCVPTTRSMTASSAAHTATVIGPVRPAGIEIRAGVVRPALSLKVPVRANTGAWGAVGSFEPQPRAKARSESAASGRERRKEDIDRLSSEDFEVDVAARVLLEVRGDRIHPRYQPAQVGI